MTASEHIEVRRIDESEIRAWGESIAIPFLSPVATEADRQKHERWVPLAEPERSWAAVDRGRFVGNAGTLTRTVTLPPGPSGECPVVPLAAVTAVGVHPTHRRRGVLRRLMGAMLEDARQRGEVVAGLQASEATIYGRFGYGWAVSSARHVLDTRHGAFAVPAPDVDIDLLIGDDAAKVVPGAFERARRRSPGQVSRPDLVWTHEIFADHPDERGRAGAMAWAVCDGGVAGWRAEEIEDPHVSGGRLLVRDLVGETPEIEAALWKFLIDIDLVTEIVAGHRPPDDPIRHRLADSRRLQTRSISDFLWLRILDTAGALTARGYLTEGRLTLDVTAPAATPTGADGRDGPDPAAGRWVLEAGPDGASCRAARSGEHSDLTLGVAELSALLAGEMKAVTLAAAGRVREERPGALAEADRLFASSRPPCSLTGF